MKKVRVSLAGFGVVGKGFVELLLMKQDYLRLEKNLEVSLVGVGNNRHGFIYRPDGLDLQALLALDTMQKPLTACQDGQPWGTILEGLRETEADVLIEVTSTNLRDAEPALSHISTALRRGTHVVTANKGPGALAGLELLDLARQHKVQLRMESSVMAGTPVLSTILEGMAGAEVQAVRGIINGTTNFILNAMAEGRTYTEVLVEAQALGYAETDPTADVEGIDALAKTLILAQLIFRQPLKQEQVECQGITGVTVSDVKRATSEGKCIKLIASLTRHGDQLQASVGPRSLPLTDPLARVDSTTNAISIQADTLPEVTIIGPGAGALVTAQGLLADLLACAK